MIKLQANWIILGMIMLFSLGLQAQETSDPKAKAALKKLKSKYDAYSSITADFTIKIELPEEAPQEIKGKMIQAGKMYKVDAADQVVLCDGETLWVQVSEDEVQEMWASDAEEESGFLTPEKLFNIYQSDDYVFAFAGEQYESGKLVQYIEFKPTDRDSEYSKMRLVLDKKNNQILRLKVFSKDGSRYTLSINKILPNKKYNKSFFQFNKSANPDVWVEDLK